MVDFNRIRRQMREAREREQTQAVAPQGTCELRDTCAQPTTQPVLETALHREMRDPQYLASLELFVDTRS